MNLNQLLPFVTTAIMFLFVGWVFLRYSQRRSAHMLMWGIGLALFAIGSFAEAYSAFAFDPLVFRLWYLCGAVLTAAWIGQGTVYLLLRKKWGHVTLAVLVLLSAAAALIMFTTDLQTQNFDPARPLSDQYATKELKPDEPAPAGTKVVEIDRQGQRVRTIPGIIPLGAPIRSTTAIFNIYGTLALVGGALYSTYLFWRKRVMGNRVIGNILIAAGALSIASASTLTRLGYGGYLYLGELIAAVAMFAGFIIASRRAQDSLEREPMPAQAASST
ncbi:MAG: hypothetical protein HY259_08365 [Chloroflexi bacterium]|nr:hypothetical protein [Chloroflexota bacterium]